MYIWTENLLPADITLDIFSRLPAESVLQCRQVCKTWRTLLHHPDFAHMHLHQSLQIDDQSYDKLSLLFFIRLKGQRSTPGYQLCYHEYDENDGRSYETKLKMINYPPIQPLYLDHVGNVGSCNGLVYFSLHIETDSIYICNPITREYVILPRFNDCNIVMEGYPNGHVLLGFGYVPATNEYKVVKISFHCDGSELSEWYDENEVDVRVYTLGSGSGWRKIKSPSLPKCELLKPWSVFANGSLYWLGNEGKSVTFDLADEKLFYIQSPTYEMDDERSYFQVWRGLLYFVHRKCVEGIDIWSFNKNKKSSTITKTNDVKEQDYQSWGWSKEFNIGVESYSYDPFALTKSGEVLMFCHRSYNKKIVSCYDPKTGNLKVLDIDYVLSNAIPHMNSFVSLRALGEDAKMTEPAERLPNIKKLKPNRYY